MQSCSMLLWPQLSTLTHPQKKKKKQNVGVGGGGRVTKQLNFVTYMHTMVTKLQLHQLLFCGLWYKAIDLVP